MKLFSEPWAELLHPLARVAHHRDFEFGFAYRHPLADRPLLDVIALDRKVLPARAGFDRDGPQMLGRCEQHLPSAAGSRMGTPFEPEVLDCVPTLVPLHAAAPALRRRPHTHERGHGAQCTDGYSGRALRTLSTPFVAAAIAAVFLASSPPAAGGSRLIVGFGDHWLLEDPTAAVEVGRDLGAAAWRVPLYWSPGQTELTPEDAATFDEAVTAAFGMRVLVVVTGKFARRPPLTALARTSYCTYVRSLLERYPTINDIVVWNEPNKFANWQPQFTRAGASAAPAAYGLLLARCWDVLHAFRPKVNLLAPGTSPSGNDNPRAVSNVSHSPGNFLLKLGAAYRTTGRTRPILDNIAHHVYGMTPAERPWRQHRTGPWIGEGDWGKLIGLLKQAFAHTRQPVPGRCLGGRCASVWYMEAGYQTTIDRAKRRLYQSSENIARTVPDSAGGERATSPPADSLAPDQATQIVDGIRLAYCQPYVAAFFNYLLRDDADLRLWQSGAVWQDGTPKDSYPAFKRAITEAKARKVNCSKLKGGPPPRA